MNLVAVAIFAVTYVLISARRIAHLGLDRPAAALLGAVACVALGVLTPDAALAAVDGDTLLLLFGVMGMGAFLVVDGFFDALEARLEPLLRSPRRLLAAIVWGAGVLSAFITNDAVCLLGAPLVVRLVRRGELPPVPFLLALATGANTGSVATLVGNPQNMLCGRLGGLDYLDYLATAGPVALMGLAINHGVLIATYGRRLDAAPRVPPRSGDGSRTAGGLDARNGVTLAVIGATALVYGLGGPLSWTAAGGFTALLLLHRRDTGALWRHVDWSLLLFFAGLFVVVEGLRESGATDWLFARFPLGAFGDDLAGHLGLSAVFLVGSNLVSNVPFILVVEAQLAGLAEPERAWTLLAIASTFAGNLTLLGSAANVIVAQAGREVGSFGFWEHLRVGLPIALLTTLAGTLWVAL